MNYFYLKKIVRKMLISDLEMCLRMNLDIETKRIIRDEIGRFRSLTKSQHMPENRRAELAAKSA